jgi:hypothetical protein
MYNRRLLLLGITIIGSGWIPPTMAGVPAGGKCTFFPPVGRYRHQKRIHSPADTDHDNAQIMIFSELFLATSSGEAMAPG